ncbi:MAG: D-Ala-D-Ala carboxypeptidase family metallohydrolase [Synechococcales bacterium]|nr:D-Ala-D-Ala carboxypeptidase family metallohydrolase [Synechococcales bacterium]
MKLIVISDTIFKLSTRPSRELADSEKFLVSRGGEFEVIAVDAAPFHHVRVVLSAPIGPQQKDTWYVYSDHIMREGHPPDPDPSNEDNPPPAYPPAQGFKLPGYRSIFYLPDPILTGGNFTWAEATKNGNCLPPTRSVVDNLIQMADVLQEIRELFGDRPVTVASWYRDPMTNRRLGGSPRSYHLTGGAVDFWIAGVSLTDVQERLDPWWGNRGGLARNRTSVHLDNRGYRARWVGQSLQ